MQTLMKTLSDSFFDELEKLSGIMTESEVSRAVDAAAVPSVPTVVGGGAIGALLGGAVGTGAGALTGSAGIGAAVGAGTGALGGAAFGAWQHRQNKRRLHNEFNRVVAPMMREAIIAKVEGEPLHQIYRNMAANNEAAGQRYFAEHGLDTSKPISYE